MDACMLHHGDFAFGETVVAPRRREVRHRGIRVDIGDRAFDLLLLLAESHGCVLSKQQIVARVWHDRVVECNAVEAQDFQLFGMWGRWMCHYLNGEYAQAIPLAHHFNELASTSSRKCDHLAALRLSGMSRLFAGDLPGALADLQRAANDTEPLPRAQRMRFLYDEKMLSHASLALTLWFMGETELARQAAQQSLDDAREFDHPVSICYALSEAVCTLALLRDDAAALEEAVSSLAAETRRHSIST